jgi:amidophosphoribosyltransferase
MAVYDGMNFSRAIHNIENTPFRTKFESDIPELKGNIGIGCISDNDPQPIILRTKIGTFAIVTVGRINNKDQLSEQLIAGGNAYFTEHSGGRINDTELVASLICRKDNIPDGISYAQSVIDGSMTLLVCADGGIYAARDKLGRTPLSIGSGSEGHCISFESFAYINLGYSACYELGPSEIVFVTEHKITHVSKKTDDMRMCTFLWTYYGYPTSDYEKINVEEMRYSCGRSLAKENTDIDKDKDIDYIAGIPDSGTAHALGYSNHSGIPFARPLIKYTPTWPRSFMPQDQSIRNLIARMKLVPINTLIKDKKLLFVDDSIVRGTQIRETVDFLNSCGAKELHMRSACPPILYSCKYLNFARSTSKDELITRRAIRELEGMSGEKYIKDYKDFRSDRYNNMVSDIRTKLSLTTLEYHSLDSLLDSVGIDKCKLCTYCWNGNE